MLFSAFEHVGHEVIEEVCRCGRAVVGELLAAVGRYDYSREGQFVEFHEGIHSWSR